MAYLYLEWWSWFPLASTISTKFAIHLYGALQTYDSSYGILRNQGWWMLFSTPFAVPPMFTYDFVDEGCLSLTDVRQVIFKYITPHVGCHPTQRWRYWTINTNQTSEILLQIKPGDIICTFGQLSLCLRRRQCGGIKLTGGCQNPWNRKLGGTEEGQRMKGVGLEEASLWRSPGDPP